MAQSHHQDALPQQTVILKLLTRMLFIVHLTATSCTVMNAHARKHTAHAQCTNAKAPTSWENGAPVSFSFRDILRPSLSSWSLLLPAEQLQKEAW